jgi:hypothetical protein
MPVSLSSASAAMHGAIVPIGYITASGSASSVAFYNIPQTYQDLMVVCYVRTQFAATTQTYTMYLNNTGYIGWTGTGLSGNGSSASSSRGVGTVYGLGDILPAANATSGIYAASEYHILNYKSSTYKTAIMRNSCDLNGSGTASLNVGLWANTSAVNQIDIATNGNLTSGSTVTLYGIRSVGQ